MLATLLLAVPAALAPAPTCQTTAYHSCSTITQIPHCSITNSTSSFFLSLAAQGCGCAVRHSQRRHRPHPGAADAAAQRRRIAAQGELPPLCWVHAARNRLLSALERREFLLHAPQAGAQAAGGDDASALRRSPGCASAAPNCLAPSLPALFRLPPYLQDTCFAVEVPSPAAGFAEFVVLRSRFRAAVVERCWSVGDRCQVGPAPCRGCNSD
jgi:hypothetical protein